MGVRALRSHQMNAAETRVMRFWRNNRLDGEFQMSIEDVAALFDRSDLADFDRNPYSLDRRLRFFLTDPAGPISAVWDEDDGAYEALLVRVAADQRRRTAGESE